ncbi:37S ribosomal protein S25 mitochondrial [Spathaspora sp. JA1]|nr:37S ribosomal protein S25 mitochondrial [Spathaspora sp. JA1]
MKVQTKATQGIIERTSHFLKLGVQKNQPAWYQVVLENPPITDLVKQPKKLDKSDTAKHTTEDQVKSNVHETYKTRLTTSELKLKNTDAFRIPKLKFFEDELRDVFYKQHPWEFARPKTLIETKGDDNSKCDWKNMLQLNKPLDGESVVQRTIYILNNETLEEGQKYSLFEAYDKARFEYYKLRMREEMESHVAREEATMYGAIFPESQTRLGQNIKNEQEYIDVWTQLAEQETRVLRASKGSKAPEGSLVEEENKFGPSIFENFDSEPQGEENETKEK